MLASLFRLFFKIPQTKKIFFGVYVRLLQDSFITRSQIKQVKRSGINWRLYIDDWIQANMYFLGYYEQEEIALLSQKLTPNGVFIDIGANVGFYSLNLAKKISDQGKVIAFEPYSINYHRLQANIKLNQLHNIDAYPFAIGNSNKELNLYVEQNSKNLGGISKIKASNSNEIQVEQKSLDNFILPLGLNQIDCIKIDIEGAEFEALQGMKQTLIQFKPCLLIEISPTIIAKTNHQPEDIYKFLAELGYKNTHKINANYLFE